MKVQWVFPWYYYYLNSRFLFSIDIFYVLWSVIHQSECSQFRNRISKSNSHNFITSRNSRALHFVSNANSMFLFNSLKACLVGWSKTLDNSRTGFAKSSLVCFTEHNNIPTPDRHNACSSSFRSTTSS